MLIVAGLFASVLPQPVINESFNALTSCVCYSEVAIYECTVCSGFATVWEGSAFECSTREITLVNSDFGTLRAVGVCNDVVGRGLSIQSGCYVSQLTITFDARLQSRTVECYADNGTHITNKIGQSVLLGSTGIML